MLRRRNASSALRRVGTPPQRLASQRFAPPPRTYAKLAWMYRDNKAAGRQIMRNGVNFSVSKRSGPKNSRSIQVVCAVATAVRCVFASSRVRAPVVASSGSGSRMVCSRGPLGFDASQPGCGSCPPTQSPRPVSARRAATACNARGVAADRAGHDWFGLRGF
jgi:hypothetical protein